jgi:penicillin-binding protein 1A
VGFTNEVTVAVWVGYDNADGKRRTLGGGATGGGIAVPIFEPVIRAVWNGVAPRTALAPPSPEAQRDLSCASVDDDSGEVRRRGTRTTSECLRVDAKGKIIDTTMALLEPGGSRHAKKKRDEEAHPKKTASRERHRRYASERAPAPQVAPQWGFFGGGGWFGNATQYGAGFWGR